MMKKRNGFLAGVILIQAFCSSSLYAENRPGALTLTVADAYYRFDHRRNLNNGNMPNLALAYNATERWAIEAGAGIINTNPKPAANNDNRGVQGQLYTLDGIYRLTPSKAFYPYIIAGIGILGLKPVTREAEHQANFNAGIGTQLFFSDSIALRGEVRDLFTTTGSAKNDVMANIGVSILFGGTRTQNGEG